MLASPLYLLCPYTFYIGRLSYGAEQPIGKTPRVNGRQRTILLYTSPAYTSPLYAGPLYISSLSYSSLNYTRLKYTSPPQRDPAKNSYPKLTMLVARPSTILMTIEQYSK
jgi:hypothetical protein